LRVRKKIYKFFTGLGSVRIMKHCDLGLENAGLGLRPWAAFSRPRSQFFTIRTFQPPNNIYLCVMYILVTLRGGNHFEPRPQNRILLPLRRSFQNFQQASSSFLYGSSHPPPSPVTYQLSFCTICNEKCGKCKSYHVRRVTIHKVPQGLVEPKLTHVRYS